MKKIMAIALAALMMAAVLTACGEQDGTVDQNKAINSNYTTTRQNENFKYDVYKDYISIDKYIGKGEDVTIPDKLDDLPVTSINSKAFNTNTEDNTIVVKKVTIPASITFIHSHAFYGCMDLEQISVDETSTSFTSENGILYNKAKTKIFGYPVKSSVTEYEIPNTVTELQGSQFAYCKNITKITIPSSVKTIGDYVFHACDGLTELVFPEGLEEAGAFVIMGCENLTTVTIPSTLDSDIVNMLSNCESLKTIKGPASSGAKRAASELGVEYVATDN